MMGVGGREVCSLPLPWYDSLTEVGTHLIGAPLRISVLPLVVTVLVTLSSVTEACLVLACREVVGGAEGVACPTLETLLKPL